jgi:uncharacterized membrane protein (DUF485 family)
MPQTAVVERVLKHPKYQELVRKRNRTSMLFFALTVIIYAGFILILAFDPELFARPLAAGMTMSLGIFVATLVAVSAVVLVALYIYISNKVFDPLLAQVIQETA